MDVVRTRMQTIVGNKSVLHNASLLVREWGIKGLYRGFWGPFYAQALYKSVIFSTNTFVGQNMFPGQKTSISIFLSGAIAGMVNAFIVSPIELIRTRQILSQNVIKSSTNLEMKSNVSYYRCIQSVISEGGVLSLWKSLFPAMLRDGPGIGAYLLTFDYVKCLLTSYVHGWDDINNKTKSKRRSDGSVVNSNVSSTTYVSYSFGVRLIAGSCAGNYF